MFSIQKCLHLQWAEIKALYKTDLDLKLYDDNQLWKIQEINLKRKIIFFVKNSTNLKNKVKKKLFS